MNITLPVDGQTNWDVPLNLALSDLDAGNIFNVKMSAFGAAGNGVSNDSAEIQAAINAAAVANVGGTTGGVVYFPPGVYPCNVTVPSNVLLLGSNRRATQLRRATSGAPVVELSGPATDPTGATHVAYAGIQNLTVNGNGLPGAAVRSYYANNLIFRDVFFTSSTEMLFDGVEFWDSRFDNCQFESSGGTNGATLPAVWLRNASSATPATFGYSTDNVNQIVFSKCRWENFHNGALRIEDGSVAGNNPNTIYIQDCKMESSQLQGGAHLFVDDSCLAIWVDNLYCFSGGFAGGFLTAQNVVDWSPARSELSNVHIANGATATVNSGVVAFSQANQRTVLRNIVGSYTTAPIGNHLFFTASTGAWLVENVYSGTGSTFGGTVPILWEGGPQIKQVAAVPTDASFVRTPLNGTVAQNSLTDDVYVRTAGVWRAIARAGSNPADQSFLGWDYDSEHASSTNILASGTVYLHKMWLGAGTTVNNVGWTITTAGATLTAGQSLMGIYDVAGTRLAQTADQSGNWTSTGFKYPALTAPLLLTTSGYYYVAILSVGTTPPTGASSPGLQTTYNANVTGAGLRHAVGATAQTALPASITMAGNTSTGVSTWAVSG